MLGGFRAFQRQFGQNFFRGFSTVNNSKRITPSFTFFKQSEVINPLTEDKSELYHVYASHPDPSVAQQWLSAYMGGAKSKNLQARLVIVPEDASPQERPYVAITFVFPKSVNTILNHIGLRSIEELEAAENDSAGIVRKPK